MNNWICLCGRNKMPTADKCATCTTKMELKEKLEALDGEQ